MRRPPAIERWRACWSRRWTRAGFAPRLASELRTLDKAGSREAQEAIRDASLREADRLVGAWAALPNPERPRLWFTYHLDDKAPDWIGPRVADALGIPYIVAEASRATKRATGPWALGHAAAEAALARADVVFVMTEADREALERGKAERQTLVRFPPSSTSTGGRGCQSGGASRARSPRLLTVAMMRPGDKLASYRILAAALARIAEMPWQLDVVGDGEVRDTVERLFASLGRRVIFHGECDKPNALAEFYAQADLLVWPAVNEAYGMALLEAQAFGCPVAAGAYPGVSAVVRDGDGRPVGPRGPAGVRRRRRHAAARPCLAAATRR